MKRKSVFLLTAVLVASLGVALRLSPASAGVQPPPAQQEEHCNRDAAQEFVDCQQAAADETQRQQCREYFECLRDACAAIREGKTPKACKAPNK